MHNVEVFFETQKVATIFYNQDKNEFQLAYDDAWILKGFELAPSLQFNAQIKSQSIKNFIENLLPEGNALDFLSKYYQISKSNPFAMIKTIGIETTGALTFASSPNEFKTEFREISEEELANRIRDKNNIPLSIWDKKPRLSVAGVQDKLPIAIIESKYGFGEGALASTHILKFNKESLNIVINEYLSMKLAKNAGLNVADVDLIKIEDIDVLLVKRFDRELLDAQIVKRLHIIDACQALDLSVSYKYERNFGSGEHVKYIREGVSYKKIFSLTQLCEIPLLAKKELITWICINLILGNSDAHGKNISFFVDRDKITLAPFYDIVNISLYDTVYEQEMAMAIDDEFNINNLTKYDLSEFYKSIHIHKKIFVNEFKRVALSIENTLIKQKNDNILQLDTHYESFIHLYEVNVLNRINELLKVI
ncbi:MAG: HipA domain-containing protein [Campylobacterales bacterium]|nr:HipA domain-containing protein [Campylobacterales bacterium]